MTVGVWGVAKVWSFANCNCSYVYKYFVCGTADIMGWVWGEEFKEVQLGLLTPRRAITRDARDTNYKLLKKLQVFISFSFICLINLNWSELR